MSNGSHDEFNDDGLVEDQPESSGRMGLKSEISKSAENLNNIDHRIKKKAKRLARHSSKEGLPNGNIVQEPRRWKNNRRPRNGFGRGLPKKGGAGGKGVWGKLGSEILEEDLDRNDPNYDSDTFDSGDTELAAIIPEATDQEIRTGMESIVLEYFEHGDTYEASLALDDISFGKKRFMLPQLAMEIAMDHKPSHREMTSVLLSDLYGHLISQNDIAKAFDLLLRNLPDLILDTPEAPTILGNFLARAVADDCIPPRMIEILREKIDVDQAKTALTRADMLLSLKHGMARLDNVWGVSGGLRPVKSLTRQMALLLQEYLSSSDLKEACRCLQDLEVPHFHHEMVYEAILLVLEAINSHTMEQLVKLLKTLSDAVIISPEMMQKGFFRVYDDMPDIILDVPLAASILERFVDHCQKAGFITDEIVRRMPARGRKRFVSEGDGGRIKEMANF